MTTMDFSTSTDILQFDPFLIFLSFAIALVAALLIHPKIVEVARLKGITDNPGQRKLQREPVPVLGGVVVFFGLTLGVGFTTFFIGYHDFILFFSLMLLMLCIGTLDDVTELSPYVRFAVEIGATLILVFLGGLVVNNFGGLWELWQINFWWALLLTIITVVGIINAINLVDGVDGLSSGYCIMACCVFAWYFWYARDFAMTSLALASAGALIPFFVFNVFGKKAKMFIGDGGTLLMGMILSIFALRMLTFGNEPSGLATTEVTPFTSKAHFGLVPFTLSILSFPICDTLRVMIMRMVHHRSPFSPDKTHLHHALIGYGFSHIRTTLCILGLNAFIILMWNILWLTGCSIDCQFYAVVGTTIVLNGSVYYYCSRHPVEKGTK